MGDPSEDIWAELERSYCPPVDSALFAAIASEYDLTVPENIDQLKQSLNAIKELAVEQENLPFDPSGTANDHGLETFDMSGMRSEIGTSVHGYESLCTATDVTSISDDSRDKNTSHAVYTIAADGSLELTGATLDDKTNALLEMFPTMTRLSVAQALKTSSEDIDRAMDVLLNLSFFDETQAAEDDDKIFIPKGIDGFDIYGGDAGRQSGRKKKRNKKQKAHLLEERAYSEPAIVNKWEAGKADIEFICSRAPDLPREKVNSAYHANGMSLPATIRAVALAEAPQDPSVVDDDPVMLAQVTELSHDYPTIPRATLIGLLRVTCNLISATNELAAVMVQQLQCSAHDLIKLSAAPLDLTQDDEVDHGPARRRGAPTSAFDYEQARAAAEVHFAAGVSAYQQASQAARRAKSNPLFAGASAVYRERGQEQRALAMNHLATASDRLVTRQSTNGDLDLHGINVTNAVRITRERVEAWWNNLGDTKHVRGGGKHVHGGYKIVTGVGNHSHDGTSRLGPAVSKMLMREGWRVEVDRGFLVVTGRARS
ncbi:uncharacterized protein N7484_004403 [Penicillium longicatenatum]|uniref:uncharacterized protein n=1 Tax=Penicillium longicatenatum TaxID=1561947 RepID=UPI00254792C0|nr:uncharacterized protein N7484_004403 [Penicillium longicatenatum]KAJ5650680.1 hypothetical protein N7484_004403 [Penicillium longicatenatum]